MGSKHLRLSALYVLSVTCMTAPALGQTVLNGAVKNTAGEAISGVSVVLMTSGAEGIIGFTFTDDEGCYMLKATTTTDSLTVKVFGLNVKSKQMTIANHSQTIDFVVEEKVTELREIVVKERKMWGGRDTINYAVAAFASQKDVTIGDVLKKLPGIDVKESGEIVYRGKSINKFYIENMDLLQGRYGIATNNIPAKDVATIQVMENHQPVKALEDIQHSDRAAINLKLKPEAKGTYTTTAKLGAGWGLSDDGNPSWEGELAVMYFGKKRQHISTLKSNNTGHDLTHELTQFNSTFSAVGCEYVSLRMPSPPSIDKSRWLRNKSHAATVNNLFKTKNDAQVNVNIIGYTDREVRDSYARTTYFVADSLLTIDEDMHSLGQEDRLTGELRYNVNEPKRYFNNYLFLSGERRWGEGDIFAAQEISQLISHPSFTATDVVHYIYRTDDERGFETKTEVSYSHTPQRLTVSPASLYEGILAYSAIDGCVSQEATTNTAALQNSFALLSALFIGNVKLTPRFSFYYQHQNLVSALSIDSMGSAFSNDNVWNRASATVSADFNYQGRDVKLAFSLPFSYNYMHYHDKLHQGCDRKLSRVWLGPHMSLQYEPEAHWTFSASASHSHQGGSPSTLYSGYILQNYRVMNRYDCLIAESQMLSGNLDVAYKDIFAMFFIGGGVRFGYNWSDVLYGQNFSGGFFSTATQIEMPNSSHHAVFSGNVSKSFEWKKLTVKAEGEYGLGASQYLQQEKVLDCITGLRSLGASVSLELMPRLLFDWNGSFGKNISRVKNGISFTPILSSNNRFTLHMPVTKACDFTLSEELYYSSVASLAHQQKFFSLSDAILNWTSCKIKWSLSCTNIFNTRQYITAVNNAAGTFLSIYDIRPVTILLKTSFTLK